MDNEQLDVILQAVLPRYGLEVRGIVPLDSAACLIDSDRGIKRLRVDTEQQKVQRRHALWEHLAKQGFRRVPRHIRTMYGEAIITLGDACYTLCDNWEGEGRVAELQPLDMRLAGRNLARLHQAAKGLQLEGDVALQKRHGSWIERFCKAGEELEKHFTAWGEHRQRNALQESFLTHYDWVAEQVGRAVEGLTAGKYEDVARRSEQEGEFAIGEYRLSDLRISAEGRVATLYADEAICDLPLYDAAKFAHGLVERGESEMAQLFLNSYAEAASLSQNEVVILDAYLAFPHSAYRHLSQYVRHKRGAEVFAERLENAVRAGQERPPILYGADSVRWT